jgi:hypothetical protein
MEAIFLAQFGIRSLRKVDIRLYSKKLIRKALLKLSMDRLSALCFSAIEVVPRVFYGAVMGRRRIKCNGT